MMTLQEFAAMGGKARWKNVPKKKRSEQMKKVRAAAKELSPTDI